MKESILSGYLWGFDKPEAADIAFNAAQSKLTDYLYSEDLF